MNLSTSIGWLIIAFATSLVLCKPIGDNYTSDSNEEFLIKFDLLPENIVLLGGRFYLGDRTGRLPWWFDFTLYKRLYKKKYDDPIENQRHHVKYVENCVETFRKRILFRILGDSHDHYIDSNSDQLDQWEAKDKSKLNEDPIALAVKLVLEELGRIESKNQLQRNMEDFHSNRTEVFKMTRKL